MAPSWLAMPRKKANKTLPQIEKLLAEAAAADAAEDACYGDALDGPTPRGRWPRGLIGGSGWPRRGTGWRRGQGAPGRAAGRATSLGRRRSRATFAGCLTASRRAAHQPQQHPAAGEHHRPDCRVMRNQKGYVAGYNGQLVTAQRVIVGAVLSWHPVDRTLLHPLLDQCCAQLTAAGIRPKLRTVLADSGYVTEGLRRGAAWGVALVVTNVLPGVVL
jgi:hypothetical protein